MRSHLIFLTVVFLSAVPLLANALPNIVIFNYSPPLPVFQLISVKPGSNEQMAKGPEAVKVSFNETIDDDSSDLTIYDPYNNVIAKRGKLTKDTSMEAAIPPNLLAGTYRIDWKATCTCSGTPSISGSSYFSIY